MVLEALQDSSRGPLSEGQRCPRDLEVEHLMPQGWRDHWVAAVGGDEIAALLRDGLVQSVGNLTLVVTLVNGKLNPTLSNRPWIAEPGAAIKGKHEYIRTHSTLKLNAAVVTQHPLSWNESAILERGRSLVDRMTAAIWPRPAGPEPQRMTDGDHRAGSS